jgi:hypothetical protein
MNVLVGINAIYRGERTGIAIAGEINGDLTTDAPRGADDKSNRFIGHGGNYYAYLIYIVIVIDIDS